MVKIIPDLNWKCLYLQNMKNIYLIQDKEQVSQVGLSYFDLQKFFDKDLKFFKMDKSLNINRLQYA